MTLYLNDETPENDLVIGKENGIIYCAKLYPKGATTNSNLGVENICDIFPKLQV